MKNSIVKNELKHILKEDNLLLVFNEDGFLFNYQLVKESKYNSNIE
ncbi:hypothetical protein GW796_10830 [archaeon]|nr:hypothetical protein [archaeon]NCQ52354.1 hypothetical protein [archaeon]